MLAPALFAVVVTLLTVLEYEFASGLGWDPVRRTHVGWPSVLALGELGWLLTATLVCCGLLGALFAWGLYRSLTETVWRTIGSALLGILALAVSLEAFTTDPPSPGAPGTWHGEIHDRAYPVVVVSAIAAPLVLALALRAEPGWRRCAWYSLATGGVLLATLVLQTERAYAQLLEYVFFGSLLLWLEVLAVRLRSRSRGDHVRRRALRLASGRRPGAA